MPHPFHLLAVGGLWFNKNAYYLKSDLEQRHMKKIFTLIAAVLVAALIAYKSGLFTAGITITSINPDTASPGQTIVLAGIGLDVAPQQTVVMFGNLSVRPESVTPEAITVVVPKGAMSGLLTIVAGEVVSNQRFIRIEAAKPGQMPPGHPPTAGKDGLPEGHPPMGEQDGMPSGHPPMAGQQQANPHGGGMMGQGAENETGSAHQFWQTKDARDFIDFTLPAADGTSVTLSKNLGSVVLINFWATWCEPCLAEVPSLERLTKRAEKLGLKVFAVSVDKSFEEIKKALPDTKLNVLLDADSSVAAKYGTVKFPETWVIDKEGKIIARFIGSRDWDSPVFVRFFELINQGGGLPEGM
jgi:peroxiredoxin